MKKVSLGFLALGLLSSGLFANVLTPAKLETGIKVVGSDFREREVLATFKKDNLNCVSKGLAKIEVDAKKAYIKFESAKCGNEFYRMSGLFFDKNKFLGAEVLIEENKYVSIPLQDGYIDTIEWFSLEDSNK